MNWQREPLRVVVDEIARRHGQLRQIVQRMGDVLDALPAEPGDPARGRVRAAFAAFAVALDRHITMEDELALPGLRCPDRTPRGDVLLHVVLRLEGEHARLEGYVRTLERACAAWGTVAGTEAAAVTPHVRLLTAALEAVLVLENGVLFPRAVAVANPGRGPEWAAAPADDGLASRSRLEPPAIDHERTEVPAADNAVAREPGHGPDRRLESRATEIGDVLPREP